MAAKKTYSGKDSMAGLVSENINMLFVLSRFGIPMGFGESTIDEVCRQNGVDTPTFLAVVNLNLQDGPTQKMPDGNVKPEAITEYLHNAHEYFLQYRFPIIKERLKEAMNDKEGADVSVSVLRFFDEYIAEVKKHMAYEEKNVFPHVRNLLQGKADNYQISVFSKRHDQIESRLNELRDILIKYYKGATGHAFNAVLFDIFTCAEDLREHNEVEDALLVPLIEQLEKQAR